MATAKSPSERCTPTSRMLPVCALANTPSRPMYEYTSMKPPTKAKMMPSSMDSETCFARCTNLSPLLAPATS